MKGNEKTDIGVSRADGGEISPVGKCAAKSKAVCSQQSPYLLLLPRDRHGKIFAGALEVVSVLERFVCLSVWLICM